MGRIESSTAIPARAEDRLADARSIGDDIAAVSKIPVNNASRVIGRWRDIINTAFDARGRFPHQPA